MLLLARQFISSVIGFRLLLLGIYCAVNSPARDARRRRLRGTDDLQYGAGFQTFSVLQWKGTLINFAAQPVRSVWVTLFFSPFLFESTTLSSFCEPITLLCKLWGDEKNSCFSGLGKNIFLPQRDRFLYTYPFHCFIIFAYYLWILSYLGTLYSSFQPISKRMRFSIRRNKTI